MAPDKQFTRDFLNACAAGDVSSTTEAIRSGLLTRANLSEGLHRAAYEGHPDVVAILFRAGALAKSAKDSLTGRGPQMPGIIRQFLDNGLHPRATLSNGEPFLCMLMDVATAREFLLRGADPNRRSPRAMQPFSIGQNPLARALVSMTGEDLSLVELLLSYGAKLESYLFFEVIHWRVKEREFKVKFLLAKGLDPNTTDKRMGTPLHRAVDLDLTNIVKLLVDAGADPAAKPEGTICVDSSPLDYAELCEGPEKQAIIDILQSKLTCDG